MAPKRGVPVTATSRLQKDLRRLLLDPVPFAIAQPLNSNILEWSTAVLNMHYVIRGTPNTPYDDGVYHGKLLFPADFPFKPPAIYMLTPSGRFQTNTRLCLNISDYHPDTWNPGWTVSAILVGLLSFMNENVPTIGSIQSSDSVKRNFARKSRQFNLSDSTFCDIFPELAQELRNEMQEAVRDIGHSSNEDSQSTLSSGELTEFSFAYKLMAFAGFVALVFAVRYVVITAAHGDESSL